MDNFIALDELLSTIDTVLNDIKENTDNNYIIKQVSIISTKMTYFKDRFYKTEKSVNDVCNKIINYDIKNMKNVQGLSKYLYNKFNELEVLVERIKDVYFKI